MKTLKIEERTVGLETVSSMEGTMDDLEKSLFDGLLPQELVDDLAALEEEVMDFDGADESENGNRNASEETAKTEIIHNTNININISVNVGKSSGEEGDEAKVGIVKDSSVTEASESKSGIVKDSSVTEASETKSGIVKDSSVTLESETKGGIVKDSSVTLV